MELDVASSRPIPEIAKQVAIFIARSNVAVRAACDQSLRNLLLTALDEGWRACLTAGRSPSAEITPRAIPRLTPLLLKRALSNVASETRSEVITIFREFPFVGVSIEGVTINSRHFLNVDVVHPYAPITPFTFDFLSENSFTTPLFVDEFAQVLRRIRESDLTVAGVTSDGCSFQKKALNWRDGQSIQARHEDFRRLIFVPCVCHLVHNSLKFLYLHNEQYHERIDEIRQAAVILRKPKYRRTVGGTCPGHCPTRWIYDWEILRFIQGHFPTIEQLFHSQGIAFNQDCLLLGRFLRSIFLCVTTFESAHSTLGSIYPAICTLCKELQTVASHSPDHIAGVYRNCSPLIAQNCFQTTNFIFQVAYVRTPTGRNEGRKELYARPIQDSEIDTEMTRLVNAPVVPGSLDDEENQITGRICRSEDSDVEDIFEGSDDSEDLEPVSRALNDVNHADDTREISDETQDQPLIRDTLYNQAERGLSEILEQFQIVADDATETIARFQEYASLTEAELPLKKRFD
jgi:hypothetical protein